MNPYEFTTQFKNWNITNTAGLLGAPCPFHSTLSPHPS